MRQLEKRYGNADESAAQKIVGAITIRSFNSYNWRFLGIGAVGNGTYLPTKQLQLNNHNERCPI